MRGWLRRKGLIMTATLAFEKAAELLKESRDEIVSGRLGNMLSRVTSREQNVGAGLTKNGKILIVTGSRGVPDYLFYNLRPIRDLPPMNEVEELTQILPRHVYHQGFLTHAARILNFLGDERPEFIIGHSLGAAAAQILGTALNLPAICFASPQVVARHALEPAPLREHTHPQWNVFNVAWKQDFVTRGYRLIGYRSLGFRVEVDLQSWNIGIDHFVTHYQELLENDRKGDKKIPENWIDAAVEPPPVPL
ncbi:MAG: hypothetical protein AAGA70_08710 [Pseudomonadota bacterium]